VSRADCQPLGAPPVYQRNFGTYHHVSKKYLPLYLNESQSRFNNRKEADIFGKAIAGC